MFYFLFLNLVLIFGAIFFNFGFFKKYFSEFSRRIWLGLAIIFLLAITLRLTIPIPHHEIYIDEVWYEQAANHFLHFGNFGDYQKSLAWPFVLSIFYSVLGYHFELSIYLSIFFGALTIFPLYFLANDLTGKNKYAWLAPVILSFFPLHIFWSATAETNVASLFFITLSLWLAFSYWREKKYSLLFLATLSFAFTAQFRPENYFYLFAFILLAALYSEKKWRFWSGKNLFPLLLAFSLSLPNLWQVLKFSSSRNWAASDSLGRLSGVSNFGWHNLFYNTLNLGSEFFLSLSLFVIIFGSAGAVYLYHRDLEKFKFFFVWFLSLWLIYFSSWFETMGGRTRFYLSFLPIFSVLAVWGFAWFSAKIESRRNLVLLLFLGLVLLEIFWFFSDSNRSYRTQALRLESELPTLLAEPVWQDCLLVAVENKAIDPEEKLKTQRAGEFLKNQTEIEKNQECVIFVADWYCERNDGGRRDDLCGLLRNNQAYPVLASYTNGKIKYDFLKIK